MTNESRSPNGEWTGPALFIRAWSLVFHWSFWFSHSDFHELFPQLAHRLRHDAHFADDAHEVRVATPSGDDVLVQVTRQAGGGAAAEVDADVEALRRHRVAKQR